MSDGLNTPEMLDWIRCNEKAAEVIRELLHDLGIENPKDRDRTARAVLARLARADIVVAWNREDVS